MFPIWGAFPAFRCRSGWIVVVPVNDGAWWLLRCDSAPVVRWSGGPVRKCTAVKGVVLWAGAEVKARSYGCDEWLGPSGACTDWVSLVILRGRERGWSFLVFSSFLFDIHLQVPYFTDLCKMFLYSVVYQTHSDTCLVFLYLIRSPLHWSSIFLSKWTLGSAALWLAGTLMVQNIGVVLQKGLVMGEHLEGRYKEGVVWWLWWRHWEVTSDFSSTFTPTKATSVRLALVWESRNLSSPWYFQICHSSRSDEGISSLSCLSGLSTTCPIHFFRAGFSH